MTRRGRAMAPTSDTTGAETLFAISAEAARGPVRYSIVYLFGLFVVPLADHYATALVG